MSGETRPSASVTFRPAARAEGAHAARAPIATRAVSVLRSLSIMGTSVESENSPARSPTLSYAPADRPAAHAREIFFVETRRLGGYRFVPMTSRLATIALLLAALCAQAPASDAKR